MKVFITGATGFVGSGIVRELRAAGHTVTALARTSQAAEQLTKMGATPRIGTLADLAGLRAAAAEADAVIHCAYNHNFTALDILAILLLRLTRGRYFAKVSPAARADIQAAEAIIDGLTANGMSGKVFISTSGIAGLPPRPIRTERDAADPLAMGGAGGLRAPTERMVLGAAKQGVRTAVIRLPPSVHGPHDHGFVPTLIALARRTKVSAYLKSGENRWPAVHRDDAAVLYRLAMEQLAAGSLPSGSALHAVADEGVPFIQLAGAIADQLGLAAPEPRKTAHFGFFAIFAALDCPATSTITQQITGWKPTRIRLLDDVRSSAYASAVEAPSVPVMS